MRIKKKHVLLESLLIDVTTEFDATEKRIFKMLYNHYGDPMNDDEEGKKPFNQWGVAAWLIESLEIPYDMAYELTKTYFWNYNKLFSEVSSLRKRIPSAELFNEHSRKLTSLFKDSLTNDTYGEIKINFDRDTAIDDIRDINFWDGYRGFTLYLPFTGRDNNGRYVYGDDSDERHLTIDVNFHTLDKEGNIVDGYIKDEDYREKVDNEKFRVVVKYTLGNMRDRRGSNKEVKLMEFDVSYPKPLSLKTYTEMINLILGDVIKKVESITFKLPSDLKGFGESSGDSQLD
jgi:hypothetical protein